MSRSTLISALGSLTATLIVLAAPAQPAAAFNAGMTSPGDPQFLRLTSAEQALIDLTNADRVANGVDPLVFDPDTLPIARERAETQLGTQSLNHYDGDGELIFARLLSEANLAYGLAGENLARASIDDASVTQRVEQALMQSPMHRRNILERSFTRIAIGAATNASGQITFAELYRD